MKSIFPLHKLIWSNKILSEKNRSSKIRLTSVSSNINETVAIPVWRIRLIKCLTIKNMNAQISVIEYTININNVLSWIIHFNKRTLFTQIKYHFPVKLLQFVCNEFHFALLKFMIEWSFIQNDLNVQILFHFFKNYPESNQKRNQPFSYFIRLFSITYNWKCIHLSAMNMVCIVYRHLKKGVNQCVRDMPEIDSNQLNGFDEAKRD